MKKLILTFAAGILLLGSLQVKSQTITSKPNWHFFSENHIPEPSADMPDWVKPLYGTSVNVDEVGIAMMDYYEANGGFKRDQYSRFYQRWSRAAQVFIDQNGYVRNWTTEELIALQKQYKGAPSNLAKSSNAWSFLGPNETFWESNASLASNWQQNIYSMDIAPSNSNILYVGGETSGVYKTTNKGLDWDFVSKGYNFSDGITAVKIHPTNPNIVLAAGGWHIHRSTDGGVTWNMILTQSSLNCTDFEFDPSNGNRVFASTEQGLMRSDDAGQTWTTILSEQFYDLEFQPGNANQLYALGRNTGTDQYVLYKSTNNGVSFSQSMSGWGGIQEGSGGKLAVSPANSNYVYAILLTALSGNTPYLMKSTNGASNWSLAATGNSTAFPMDNGQGYYDLAIVVSHSNADHIIVGTQTMYRSTDGGSNFSCLSGYCSGGIALHPDVQDALCAGGDCWIATDGGMTYSTDFFGSANFSVRNKGIEGSDMWGYSQGWNIDMFVGGRYHNGNTSWHENYPTGQALRLGGAESATGWILHGREPEAYFDDIGGGATYLIPQVISDPLVSNTSFTKHPNKVYGHLTSRLLTHPENAAIHFTGEGNAFWRSDDAGANWTSLHDFGEKTWWFELSRSNPDVMYLFTQSGFHKTTDGGANWTNITAQLPSGFGSHDRGRVTVDGTDENTLWILRHYGANGQKIYKSTDGGMTWTNWTTSTLDGMNFRTVTHVLGTNGGVYLASIKGSPSTYPAKVFYRNNTDSDWRDCSTNVPAGFNPLKLIPFYRDSKIRLAGNMGVWESALEEPFNIIAQPMIANKTPLACLEDIQFECYSILDHAGATWSWSFPGASSVNSTTVRNPVVQYNGAGTYTATLTITRGVEMSTKSIQVVVGGSCPGGISSNYGIDTDKDGIPDIIEATACQHTIPQGATVSGSNVVMTTLDFGGATTGMFAVDLNINTNCYNVDANFKAFVNLDNQTIDVIAYDHFDNFPNDITGNMTNSVTSVATGYAQLRFTINGTTLDVIQVSNACGGAAVIRLEPSCWTNTDTDGDGIMNHLDTDSDGDGLGDTSEATICTNIVPQSTGGSGNGVFLGNIDFGGATTGIFYLNAETYTNCYGSISNVRAYVDLDQQIISVIEHTRDGTVYPVTGNHTNFVKHGGLASIDYILNGSTIAVWQANNACGSYGRVNESCWSSIDQEGDNIPNFLDTDSDNDCLIDILENTDCGNSIAQGATIYGDGMTVETLNFGGASSGIFYVNLNLSTNCYSRTAKLRAFVNLNTATIEVIEYDHFGPNDFTNDITGNYTDEVTSVAAGYAQLRFKLNGTNLEVIQLTNACGGGAYMQMQASCWSSLDVDATNNYDFLEASSATVLKVDVRAFLQGPYNATNSNMNTQLTSLIPLSHPYSSQHIGTEGLGGFVIDIVDWVLVELRQPANTVLARRAALLRCDGKIVDLDGVSPIAFKNMSAGNYYVSVRHRNHLGVMTQNAVNLN